MNLWVICYHVLNAFHALHHLSLEQTKLIAIVNWIFTYQTFWDYLLSFKNGLILLRYSSIDKVLLLSLLFSYSI